MMCSRARQNFRYQDSDVSMDQVYSAGWADADSNILNRAYTGGDKRLHSYIIDNMLQAEFLHRRCQAHPAAGRRLPAAQGRRRMALWLGRPATPATRSTAMATFRYWAENRYQRRLQQTGVYLQDLVELDQWRFPLGLRARTGSL